ncbi:MAG: hypothetical protein HIU91_10130 [Acidobacteria bacterium]|nr:hypothetical protein [Acidobacteriota bacterium]
MSKIVGVLFPWRKTFKRLELEERWWHRLASVLFFVVLAVTLLYSWVIANDARTPVHPVFEGITNWAPIPMGATVDPADVMQNHQRAVSNSEQEDTFDQVSPTALKQLPELTKDVQMPDGTTASYSGTTSDAVIKADWQHRLDIATRKALILGLVTAILVTVALSYMLQASYRALLYVIYGAMAKAAPDNQAAG